MWSFLQVWMWAEVRSHAWQPCRYSPALEDKEHTMRAAQFLTPGEPSVIKTRRIPRPQCCEMTQMLIKVGTGGLNPIDFKMRRNQYVNTMRSLPIVSGYDFSGHVERIGTGVLGFRPGDTVYGMLPLQGTSWGAFQEYVVANYSIIAHVPSKITAREAAGLPLVGLTTIQAMAPVLRHFRKQEQSSKGKKILIQAGGGGVGSFAIQYCKNVPLGFASRSLVSHVASCHLSSFGLSARPFSIHLVAFVRLL